MPYKRILGLLLIVVLFVAALSGVVGAAKATDHATPLQFKTPEEAVTAYLEGMAQGDVTRILQACAIDEMTENFKFDRYIDRLKAFQPYQAPGPDAYPFYKSINKAALAAQILGQVKIVVYALLSTEDVGSGKVLMFDAGKTARFAKDVDPARLSGLKLKQIGMPNKKSMSSATYVANAARTAAVYGADELTERVALFAFEQNDYIAGFTLLRYGTDWKIDTATSAMANISAFGVPLTASEADFATLTAGN
jgi:hypothetical protein